MKPLARVLIGTLALIGVFAIGIALMAYIEVPKSRFANYQELVDSDLIAKGWLPNFMPRSIRDVTESHDLDSNRVWATFTYDRTDISSIDDNCQLVLSSLEGRKYVCPPYEKQMTIIILKSDGKGSLESEPNEL